MTDFSHLQKHALTAERTAEFTFYQLAGEPTFIVVSASDTNRDFTNAVLKRSGKNMRRVRNGAMTAGMLKEARDQDRELYPRYIIKGWLNVQDAKGKSVAFTPGVCHEYLKALPDYLFDELRAYCDMPANFLEEEDMVDVEQVAKN